VRVGGERGHHGRIEQPPGPLSSAATVSAVNASP
jgi:hypothetical protein